MSGKKIVSQRELSRDLVQQIQNFKDSRIAIVDGCWYMCDGDKENPIYERMPDNAVAAFVADQLPARPGFTTLSHYKSVSLLAMADLNDPEFFSSSPVGFPGKSRFYCSDGRRIKYSPDLRVTYKADFDPNFRKKPRLFLSFLDSHVVPECREYFLWCLQKIIFREFSKEQLALLLIGPSRCGKSAFLKFLNKVYTGMGVSCSVQPARWHHAGAAAQLVDAVVNIVGEIPANQRIVMDVFKNVLGGDPLNAKLLWKNEFSFVCRAAHIFAGNNFPLTDCPPDDSFRDRWAVIRFQKHLVREERDPDFHNKLYEEREAIFGWIIKYGFGEKSLRKSRLYCDDLCETMTNPRKALRKWLIKEVKPGEYLRSELLRKWQNDPNVFCKAAINRKTFKSYLDSLPELGRTKRSRKGKLYVRKQ